MKLKIRVKEFEGNKDLVITSKGDWIDLRAAKEVSLEAPKVSKKGEVNFDVAMIPLGVAMKLPAGYEAVAVPRSSTFKNFGMLLTNSQGVIDNSYQGDNDQWWFQGIALRKGIVCKGERICQFRVQLSQKATMWQKIKNLFYSGVEIIYVDSLKGEDRGGFGTSGKK